MILWTVQREWFLEELERNGFVRAEWSRILQGHGWLLAYRWMAAQMVIRGYCEGIIAPIWAWHSCGAVGRSPDQDTIDSLMGHDGSRVVMIEMEVPDEKALLSHYGVWNDIVDECLCAGGDESKVDPGGNEWERVFDVDAEDSAPWGENNWKDIQACLPHVEASWVRGHELYDLPRM